MPYQVQNLLSCITMAILSIFFSVAFLPHLLPIDPYSKYTQLNLPPGSIGRESVALDRFNQGPYVGVSDGRILKYQGPTVGFVDFALVAPKKYHYFHSIYLWLCLPNILSTH